MHLGKFCHRHFFYYFIADASIIRLFAHYQAETSKLTTQVTPDSDLSGFFCRAEWLVAAPALSF